VRGGFLSCSKSKSETRLLLLEIAAAVRHAHAVRFDSQRRNSYGNAPRSGVQTRRRSNHQLPLPRIQDTAHAGFELGCLAVLLDDKIRLNALLAGAGRSERVALSTPLFVRFANTFLRKIWHYDYQNASALRNVLDETVDGKSNPTEEKNANEECAGWIPLAQFDRWMWIRCRDATFHAPGYLREDNHAALLRYRQFL
jgi:hypothetical protein